MATRVTGVIADETGDPRNDTVSIPYDVHTYFLGLFRLGLLMLLRDAISTCLRCRFFLVPGVVHAPWGACQRTSPSLLCAGCAWVCRLRRLWRSSASATSPCSPRFLLAENFGRGIDEALSAIQSGFTYSSRKNTGYSKSSNIGGSRCDSVHASFPRARTWAAG